MGDCKVTPESHTYSSHVNKLTELDKGIDSKSFYDGALHNSWMDLHPHLVVNFGATKKPIVGLALKGPPTAHKKYGFPSFQVYQYVDNGDFYDAIRENYGSDRIVKTFTGLTAEDIENGQVKKHKFPYPVEVKKLKIYVKLRLGQKRICTKIEFYHAPENCGQPLMEENKCDNASCKHMCVKKNHIIHCTCPRNKVLWLDGLHCVATDPDVQITSKPRNMAPRAQQICSSVDSKLATIFNLAEYNEMKKVTEKNREDHFIGVVDVDQDQSYSRWIDGTDVVFDKFEETRRYPGSIGLMSGNRWTFKNSSDGSKFLCRSGTVHGYLFTSFFGIDDYQITSTISLVKTSLASVYAFGPGRSRRGSKAYLTSDSGESYGLFWRPTDPTMKNKFLRVKLLHLFRVTGIFVKGYMCENPTITYTFRNRENDKESYMFSVPAHSETLQLVMPLTRSKHYELKFDKSADCEGYHWDLVGEMTVRHLSACSCPGHCIKYADGKYCWCKRNHHLFFGGRHCVKDSQPQWKGPKLLALEYHTFRNMIPAADYWLPTYYTFSDEKMDFSRAAETCKQYGGYLPCIHLILEHRLMYSDLMSHPTCTKWFLGLNGTSLMHSAWHDGSWVELQ
ncbi:uncharacterized protein LOC121383901 [Gigantopelta aegis]|uniref:uncharacterized protein LOC121383901 n=1 Tax=Gigantopelta aegis TaxID=1735272 RepID=UPI001B88A7DF|nr:uncharacterized protein LOC121383901 [Gigantopelta aegis]